MQRTPAARARGISKYYGDIVALDGVDLDVEPGQVHGLVGPNGAGKTTLLGLLLGLATADAGTLEILGRPVGRSLAVADGVAGFVDGPGLYPSLTARQNLTALAALRGTRPVVAADGRRGARAGRTERRRRRPRSRLLAGDAAAARSGGGAAHPPAAADPRRAGQRPRPGRQAPRASGHQRARRRRRRGRPLQPPDGRPGRAVRRGDDPRHWTRRLLRPRRASSPPRAASSTTGC